MSEQPTPPSDVVIDLASAERVVRRSLRPLEAATKGGHHPRASALSHSLELADLRLAVEATDQPLLVLDHHQQVAVANHAARDLFGLADRGPLTLGLRQLLPATEISAATAALERGETWQSRIERIPGSAARTPVHLTIQPARSWPGTSRLVVVGTLIDSDTDTVAPDTATGLLRRQPFLDAVDAILAQPGPWEGVLLVAQLAPQDKIDFGGELADTVGADPALLVAGFAQRLARLLPTNAVLGRVAPDRMAGYLPAPIEASAVAALMASCTAAPYHLDGQELILAASSGVAATTPGRATDAATLLSRAEAVAFQASPGTVGRFTPFAPPVTSTATNAGMSAALRRALRDHELVLHYQPIRSLRQGRVVAAEALVRWQPADGPLLMPGTFLPCAEEAGLMDAIGEWVLDEACRQLAAWGAPSGPQPRPMTELRLSVNVSAGQLVGSDLADGLFACADRHDVDPSRLIVELTETTLLPEGADAVRQLQRLRAAGVTVALDDFGTGYSSLRHLRQLPVDAIKIDRAFVAGIAAEPADRAIIAHLLQLARALGVTVVAEGVETPEQLGALKQLACPLAQGYHLGRPVAGDVFPHRLKPSGS